MSYSVVVSYNSANPKEHKIITKLLDYLGTKNIDPVGHDPNIAEVEMKQWLLNAKWLVLFLTPEAIRSPQVQSLVDAAFVRVKQGLMQGVLALAFSSNPVDLEDLPPLWSTIRIYYVDERNEDQLQAFEKLSRTLVYGRVPVPATSSSTNNWASPYSSAASRPLATLPQPTRRSNSRLVISVVAALILIIFFLVFFTAAFRIFKGPTTSTPTPDVKATKVAHANVTATARANATATARANATATAVSLDALYSSDTSGKPTFSMNAQDNSQGWENMHGCKFNDDGTYQVTTIAGQHNLCLDKNMEITTNFAYQAQMTIGPGDSGGLIFGSDGLNTFYLFSLDNSGKYILVGCQPSICSDTKIDSENQLIAGKLKNVGQTNTLTVIAKDKTIYLYINTKLVDQVKASTISLVGEIGVYAASETPPTKVVFSEVKVWEPVGSDHVKP